MVISASELKSEDPGFDPLVGQGEGAVYLSLRVNSWADLFVPDPSFVLICGTQMCAHVKDPFSICRKKVGINAEWYGHTKIVHALG